MTSSSASQVLRRAMVTSDAVTKIIAVERTRYQAARDYRAQVIRGAGLDRCGTPMHQRSLRTCNAKASLRMRLCMARSSHLNRVKFILNFPSVGRTIASPNPAMTPGLFYGKESNMIKKLLGAATMAAVILAIAPASAAKLGGCSSENMMKTESMIEGMADGPDKITSQKEIAMAQTAMLDGKMGACAVHLTKAMHVGTMNQAASK
jgi:hypothetical protein